MGFESETWEMPERRVRDEPFLESGIDMLSQRVLFVPQGRTSEQMCHGFCCTSLTKITDCFAFIAMTVDSMISWEPVTNCKYEEKPCPTFRSLYRPCFYRFGLILNLLRESTKQTALNRKFPPFFFKSFSLLLFEPFTYVPPMRLSL